MSTFHYVPLRLAALSYVLRARMESSLTVPMVHICNECPRITHDCPSAPFSQVIPRSLPWGFYEKWVGPVQHRVDEKEQEKVEKYQDLKREIGRMWGIRKVQVVPVVIGALGSVPKGFDKWIEKLDIPCNIVDMQKTALLGTARILRKVLEM